MINNSTLVDILMKLSITELVENFNLENCRKRLYRIVKNVKIKNVEAFIENHL